MEIRPYQEKDRERMHKICFETSTGFNSEKGKVVLYTMYCDYYINEEPESCFVAVNENDEAIGYIICAPDDERYQRIFKEKYAPILKKASLFKYLFHYAGEWYTKKARKLYPAHLHIDILEEGQRKGLGTALVDTLVAYLKGKGVKGLHLGCSASNEKGVNFYRKYGFKEYDNKFGGITFVMDL